jgi:hypothetical protein
MGEPKTPNPGSLGKRILTQIFACAQPHPWITQMVGRAAGVPFGKRFLMAFLTTNECLIVKVVFKCGEFELFLVFRQFKIPFAIDIPKDACRGLLANLRNPTPAVNPHGNLRQNFFLLLAVSGVPQSSPSYPVPAATSPPSWFAGFLIKISLQRPPSGHPVFGAFGVLFGVFGAYLFLLFSSPSSSWV